VQQIEDDTGLNANDAGGSHAWPQVLDGATTRGRSSVPVSECPVLSWLYFILATAPRSNPWLTVYRLKDALSPKDVPFGGLDDDPQF